MASILPRRKIDTCYLRTVQPAKSVIQNEISLDFETFSEAELKKVGSHKYAMDPSTEVLCFAWARYDEEPQIWRPGMPFPDELADHILMGGRIRAWNALFERLIFTHVGSRYGWPVPAVEQYVCTMTEAYAMALPGKLETCAPAVGLEIKKDAVGNRVMLKLCKPRRPTKKDPSTRHTRERNPSQYEILEKYCLQDVRVEQAIAKCVTRLNEREQHRYWRDQIIQDRGIHIDLDLVDAAHDVVQQKVAQLDQRINIITNRAVASTKAAKQITTWLGQSGVKWPEHQVPSIDKDNVMRLLARDDLTDEQREVIEIRQEAAKASTAKLDRFQMMVCADDTIKGSLQFGGTSTGRDAARGVQLQNLPRPNKKTKIALALELLQYRDADMLETVMGQSPMGVVSDILRSCVIAGSHQKLYTRDLSQIEARMTNYLAGEKKGVEAFRKYDRKEGPDIYVISASGIYNCRPEDVDAVMRNVGKVATLALGFGGGAGAFGSMAKLYFVDLEAMFPSVWSMADQEQREKAEAAWKQRGRATGLRKAAWLASELVKIMWRESNPNIVQYWRDLENAAVDALLNPGKTYTVRGVSFRKTGSFLRMVLISGRSLFFPFPRLSLEKTPWGKDAWKIYFKANDSQTKRFLEFSMYGGFLCQNAVQATARDVMWEIVERVEDAGYPNVLRVHDEIICETDDDFGSEEEFHSLVTQAPAWAPGLPIASDGYVAVRYRK